MVRVGIIGGTFDPPHLAHMVVAEAAFRQFDLDIVWFVPAGDPWQKSARSITPARHRWAMTLATTAGIPYFKADDREIRRAGSTFTIDTLTGMDHGVPYLILGADAAAGLPSWHRAGEVMDRARILVAPRSGTARESVDRMLGRHAEWLDLPRLNLSSTELRSRAANGGSLRFLVREPVNEYIERHRLYRRSSE